MVEEELSGKPGEILSADKTGVRIACGQGCLVIGELQLPGKKRLSAMNFLSGKPLLREPAYHPDSFREGAGSGCCNMFSPI